MAAPLEKIASVFWDKLIPTLHYWILFVHLSLRNCSRHLQAAWVQMVMATFISCYIFLTRLRNQHQISLNFCICSYVKCNSLHPFHLRYDIHSIDVKCFFFSWSDFFSRGTLPRSPESQNTWAIVVHIISRRQEVMLWQRTLSHNMKFAGLSLRRSSVVVLSMLSNLITSIKYCQIINEKSC